VDRAALNAAMRAGLPVEGYCTKGGQAVDELIPENHTFQELETTQHQLRIENNVVISDGTLIINKGPLTNGTKLSFDFSVKHLVPCLIVQLDAEEVITPPDAIRWIHGQEITTLNVAGPRESKFPEGIYDEAFSFLKKLFRIVVTGQQYSSEHNYVK